MFKIKQYYFFVFYFLIMNLLIKAHASEIPYWKSYFVQSALYLQQTSTVSNTENDIDGSAMVSSQNMIFDTYTAGKLGNSTYFGFVESVFGKLNGSRSNNPRNPYGDDLLQLKGQLSQQWSVTDDFSMGWNYFGLARTMSHIENERIDMGYRFDSMGLTATYRWNDWTFMPQLNYVFNGVMGSMFQLDKDVFDGIYVLPIVKVTLLDNGTSATLIPEFFHAEGDKGSRSTYMKWQLRLSAPLAKNKRWWVNARFEHQKHYVFNYQGINLNPDYDTSVSVGVQYNW